MKKIFAFILILSIIAIYTGCKKDSNPVNNTNNSDIPTDPTNVTVPTTTINNVTPTAAFSKTTGNESRIRMNLTGLINPVTNQPIQLVAQQNLFVTEDSQVKGLLVTKVGTGNVLKADIVFTVDNSGSMDEEADSIAASIIKFSQTLQSSGLDVKFGCVGYYGEVNGAINFTNAQSLSTYLNHSQGTSRTEDFAGPDSASLYNSASQFAPYIYDENGVVAVFFADNYFNWRSDAQRVFINFTDESTQPNGYVEWSTQQLCQVMGGKATVHTIYSGPADTSYGLNGQWDEYNERPWEMSLCTGGTIKFIPENASGLDLSQLPVTGALSNSYLIEFITSGSGSSHTIGITVKESNADGKRIYQDITY